jgi:hypothetical protein
MSDEFDQENALRAYDLIRDAPLVAASPLELSDRAKKLWHDGLPSGDKTGWPSVDRHYTVVPGQLTILTGWPGSGKSEWLDALLLNLARLGWRFSIFSPENQPVELHIAKFLEKFHGKPFGHGPTERMSVDELTEGLTEFEDWFSFIVPSRSADDRTTFGVDEILKACEAHFRMQGTWRNSEVKKGLVIDPWNELEHLRPKELSETEYISQTLSRIRGWADFQPRPRPQGDRALMEADEAGRSEGSLHGRDRGSRTARAEAPARRSRRRTPGAWTPTSSRW